MDPKEFDESYEENIESAESSFLEDRKSVDGSYDKAAGSVLGFVEERFKRAEDARLVDEQRWMQAYRNYRGLYGPDVQFTETERSRVFVKITKTKALAAYGQIIDVFEMASDCI
jgi:hypothetical protein